MKMKKRNVKFIAAALVAVDANIILRFCLYPKDYDSHSYMDVNKDKKISPADATLILRFDLRAATGHR
jgi:hypothetical protein